MCVGVFEERCTPTQRINESAKGTKRARKRQMTETETASQKKTDREIEEREQVNKLEHSWLDYQ